MIVGIFNYDARCVVFITLPGFCFGLMSAVTIFNAFPEFSTHAARLLLLVPTDHFYDDNDTIDPLYGGSSAQDG